MKIDPGLIENLQHLEVFITGPDDANRLFSLSGQILMDVQATTSGQATDRSDQFTVLLGPILTRTQFVRATATVSLSGFSVVVNAVPVWANWSIDTVDADWDDESGQTELSFNVKVGTSGINNGVHARKIAFQLTILASVAAS